MRNFPSTHTAVRQRARRNRCFFLRTTRIPVVAVASDLDTRRLFPCDLEDEFRGFRRVYLLPLFGQFCQLLVRQLDYNPSPLRGLFGLPFSLFRRQLPLDGFPGWFLG